MHSGESKIIVRRNGSNLKKMWRRLVKVDVKWKKIEIL